MCVLISVCSRWVGSLERKLSEKQGDGESEKSCGTANLQ